MNSTKNESLFHLDPSHLRWRRAFCMFVGLALPVIVQAAQPGTGSLDAPPASKKLQTWTLEPITVSGAHEGYIAPTSASATRTDTPLIEVPQSVQVVTQTMIKEQGSHTLARVVIGGRDEVKLAQAALEIDASGKTARAYAGDIAQPRVAQRDRYRGLTRERRVLRGQPD